MLEQTEQRLETAQKRYQYKFHRRLRNSSLKTEADNFVHLRIEWQYHTNHLDKLDAVSEPSFQVTDVDVNKLIIEKSVMSVGRVSHSPVILADDPIPSKTCIKQLSV